MAKSFSLSLSKNPTFPWLGSAKSPAKIIVRIDTYEDGCPVDHQGAGGGVGWSNNHHSVMGGGLVPSQDEQNVALAARSFCGPHEQAKFLSAPLRHKHDRASRYYGYKHRSI